MTDNPTPIAAGELNTIRDHALRARLSALHSVDSECVAKAHALRCKWVEENR